MACRSARSAARDEQLLLRRHLHRDQRISRFLHELGVVRDGVRPALLGDQSCLHGAQSEIAVACRLEIGAHQGVVQAHQALSFPHMLAFAHQDLADDAPGQVLHHLSLGVDGNRARAGHAFVERRERGP
jgi:hypothetical protein